MTAWRRRRVLFRDEWLSIALLLALVLVEHFSGRPVMLLGWRALWVALVAVIAGVYVVGYGTQWWAERREERN